MYYIFHARFRSLFFYTMKQRYNNKTYVPSDLPFVFSTCVMGAFDNVVEIKFTVVISLLEWPSYLFTWRSTGKYYALMEQNN